MEGDDKCEVEKYFKNNFEIKIKVLPLFGIIHHYIKF